MSESDSSDHEARPTSRGVAICVACGEARAADRVVSIPIGPATAFYGDVSCGAKSRTFCHRCLKSIRDHVDESEFSKLRREVRALRDVAMKMSAPPKRRRSPRKPKSAAPPQE